MAPEAHQIELAMAEKKSRASDWFRALRDDICAAFEAIEDLAATPQKPAGRFERKSWDRDGGGGGEMSLMRGQVFEKVGVNISTVFGAFSDDFKTQVRGAETDGSFWASGQYLPDCGSWHISPAGSVQPHENRSVAPRQLHPC